MTGRANPKKPDSQPTRRGRERSAGPTLEPERDYARRLGVTAVAGLDEAGRGALAGPIYAAAVVLPPDADPTDGALRRVNDSKKLSPAAREALFPLICEIATGFGIGAASAEEIDRLGIVPATHTAMLRALAAICPAPEALLVDGLLRLPTETPQRALVRGDSHSLSIAAASILAKVSRDRYMIALDAGFPEYGFAGHKGYGTARHLRAIEQIGPCPEHRLSFAPLNGLPGR